MILKFEGEIQVGASMNTEDGSLQLLISEEYNGVDSCIEIHLTREMAKEMQECLEATLAVDNMKVR